MGGGIATGVSTPLPIDVEAQTNRLRLIAIAVFYLIELVNYYGLNLGFIQLPQVVDKPFHESATALAACWVIVAIATRFLRLSRIWQRGLPFLATAADLVLLTCMLMIADGPRSPLVVAYFVILAGAALRLELSLVQYTTVGTIACYLYLSGFARWFTDRELYVPRYHQLIFIAALALTGVILGQVIRRVREQLLTRPR
jgi:hypothetical protein